MLGSVLGKHNVSLIKSWYKTGAMFGIAGGSTFLYITDWKLVLQYLPIYNTKFKEDSES